MQIQAFSLSDLAEVARLFRETVSSVNAKDYRPDQVSAWTAAVDDEQRFGERLSSSFTVVARIDDTIAGFGNLLEDGHLDCLYVHRDYQRRGIASALLRAIEERARKTSQTILRTEASITALPFFSQNGFTLLREQQATFNGAVFQNFLMEKKL